MRDFNLRLGALLVASSLAGCGGTTGAAGADSGVTRDGSFADGPSDDGGDGAVPGCLALGATTASCRSCCANGFAAGSQVFDRFTAICACQPALCGVPDAGVVDASGDDGGDGSASAADGGDAGAGEDAGAATDAGLYGQAVCAATCTGKEAPNPVCNTCILSTLGSVDDLGPCGSTVLAQCLTDTTCSAYFGCVENCPP